MSLNSALLAGVSGLIANSSALSSVANNIANANTVGYKTVNTEFEDLVGVSAGAGNYSAGGVQADTQQLVSQSGNTQQTTSATDLSITGNGMFVVTSTATPTASDTRSYTEAGSFTVDANGNLVNAAGYYLQGFPVDETTGAVTVNPSELNSLATINVGDVGGTATPTTTVTVNQNLDSAQAVSTAAAATDPSANIITAGTPPAATTLDTSATGSLATALAADPTGVATVTVTNSSGQVVFTDTSQTLSALQSAGSYQWNGTETGGANAPAGDYNISITDPSGNSLISGAYNAVTNNMAMYNANTGVGVKPDAQITIPIANSQGGQQTVTLDLLKSPTANQWYAEVVAPDGNIQYGTGSVLNNNQLSTGTLSFNQDGSINLANSTVFGSGNTSPTLDFGASGTTPTTATGYAWGNSLGIAAQKISLNLATSTGGITQLDSATLTQSIEADGTAFGSLNNVSIDSNGFVTATYSNGVSKQIAQVALATFSNPDGLTAVTGDAYQVSTTSGSFNLKAPGSAGAGTITPDSLEASTVDLSSQFASLITTQQAYSASAKVLTTADNMEQALIQVIQ
jgi:flagellar hook protein FlgE